MTPLGEDSSSSDGSFLLPTLPLRQQNVGDSLRYPPDGSCIFTPVGAVIPWRYPPDAVYCRRCPAYAALQTQTYPAVSSLDGSCQPSSCSNKEKISTLPRSYHIGFSRD